MTRRASASGWNLLRGLPKPRSNSRTAERQRISPRASRPRIPPARNAGVSCAAVLFASVTLSFPDGATRELNESRAHRLFERLWHAGAPASATAASKIAAAIIEPAENRKPVQLTEREAATVQAALQSEND
jgi:hypothetical protein